MSNKPEFRYDLDIFGVARLDPGSIYIIENGDLLKVGKTNNPKRRIDKEAKTWLPDLRLIGAKPFWNISGIERDLHTALCRYWYQGEWYRLDNKHDYELIVGGFLKFDDEDRDHNSVDFIYWMNSNGMSEFCMERHSQNLTLPQFQRQESDKQKEN